jgi:hypothetical protein
MRVTTCAAPVSFFSTSDDDGSACTEVDSDCSCHADDLVKARKSATPCRLAIS